MALKIITVKFHQDLIHRLEQVGQKMSLLDESAIYFEDVNRAFVLRLAIFKGLKHSEKGFGLYYDPSTQPLLDPRVNSEPRRLRSKSIPDKYVQCTVKLQTWLLVRIENLTYHLSTQMSPDSVNKDNLSRAWMIRACAYEGLKILEDEFFDPSRPALIGSQAHQDFMENIAQFLGAVYSSQS